MTRLIVVTLCGLSVWGQSRGTPDCTFQVNPNEYLTREARIRREVFDSVSKFAPRAAGKARATVDASTLPRRNFIDEYIFDSLQERGIPAAALSSDEEFLRRVTLDLTGRIPAPADIRAFVASTDEDKRDKVIEKLIASEEFTDKWTMWLGDLLKNNSFPSNFDRQQEGRNAYHLYMRQSIAEDKSLKTFVYDLITGYGNSFEARFGNSNFPIASKTPMGPIQDTYDTMVAMSASTFLGLGEMDCLLCHNGRGHLEQVNVWGSKLTRLEAWKMSAFFTRLSMPQRNVPSTDPYYRSFDVSDVASGSYALNTNWGNRPDRRAIGNVSSVTPEYIGTGATPKDGNWRVAFAQMLVNDRMFARNFANRIWKELFNLALVEPMDSLDPARLDPENPPEEPWTLQATHPKLLEQTASFLKAYDFNLRGFVKSLVQSTAYQLSARYDGEWKYEYVTSFARHYPRRLMAEEVHDAITKSTGVGGSYTVLGFKAPLTWAMQLPEPAEPRSNGTVATFLNLFLRGNRDSQPRSTSLSILQQMNMMNDSLVMNRVRVGTSPTLTAISKLSTNGEVVEELSLLLLSRMPTEQERATSVEYLAKAKDATERNTFIEDLAWALMNKPEFIFSY